MEKEFLTSAEVGKLLGVGATSVKRWADSGLLPCLRTPGKHRRFLRDEVERFRRRKDDARAPDPAQVGAWIQLLRGDCSAYEVHSALLFDRSRYGSWWQVADLVGAVSAEIGRMWQEGEVSVVEEHAMSERLARGLARCSESLAVRPGAPACLLATAETEEDALPLSLAELCLRESGWSAAWGGRLVPEGEIEKHLTDGRFAMLALSASERAAPEALAREARDLAAACAERGVRLVLGGSGAWPEPAPGEPAFERVRSFREFNQILASAAR